MIKNRIHIVDAEILILGLTFKENCPDLRNSKVFEVVDQFKSMKCNIDVYDPWVNETDIEQYKEVNLVKELKKASVLHHHCS